MEEKGTGKLGKRRCWWQYEGNMGVYRRKRKRGGDMVLVIISILISNLQ